MKKYEVDLQRATESEEFLGASAEELRVLIALIQSGGCLEDADKLAETAKTTRARARAALVFWEEEGVIAEDGANAPTLTEEFEERVTLGKITERPAQTVAKEIRDNNLSDLLAECAAMMQKPALSTEEAKIISALYTQYSLGEEFIITLSAYLCEKGKLTAQRLGAEAEKMIKRGIDCVEELEKYINAKENESGAEWEFKRLLGIYNRNLSKGEQKLVNKWYGEYGFSEEIVGEAYDVSVMNTSKLSLPYMDKLLTHWHDEGCKTLEDCRRLGAKEKAEMEAQKAEKKPPSLPRKSKAPRYGDFDVNDAFEKALLRSYGEEDKKD